MNKGEKVWIRLRGAPDDPESFDLATWSGVRWEIPYLNSLGDTILIQIPDYLVVEKLPASTDLNWLYRESGEERKKE